MIGMEHNPKPDGLANFLPVLSSPARRAAALLLAGIARPAYI
jgi:hypothetical protein